MGNNKIEMTLRGGGCMFMMVWDFVEINCKFEALPCLILYKKTLSIQYLAIALSLPHAVLAP